MVPRWRIDANRALDQSDHARPLHPKSSDGQQRCGEVLPAPRPAEQESPSNYLTLSRLCNTVFLPVEVVSSLFTQAVLRSPSRKASMLFEGM